MKTNFKKMFAVTIALSVLCFGFTARSVDSTDMQSKENVRLATALTGCVIVEEDEMGIIYRKNVKDAVTFSLAQLCPGVSQKDSE